MIVDDDGPVRESLALLLDAAGFGTRCHRCGEELLECGPPTGPACLLLDLEMPGMNGTEVQKRLADADWNIPIVFLTGHGDVPAAVKALKGGAVDFLQKSEFRMPELLEMIEQCVADHRRGLVEGQARARQIQLFELLTGREFEVARLASSGATNKAIGLELGISERTVEIHRGRAMKKLGLRTVAELARLKPDFDRFASTE